MRQQGSKVHINNLLALLIYAVFAVSILLVLTTGAEVYRRLVERDDRAYTWRTAECYVTARVHRAVSPGCVRMGQLEGVPALVLEEEVGGLPFFTYLYCYDGQLRELFCMAGSDLSPADGEAILPMDSLEGEAAEGVLAVTLTDGDGESRRVLLSLEKGGEGQ